MQVVDYVFVDVFGEWVGFLEYYVDVMVQFGDVDVFGEDVVVIEVNFVFDVVVIYQVVYLVEVVQ